MLTVADARAADQAQCKAAINKYNSAIKDVSEQIGRYASCVRDSKGFDDCSSEFFQLKNAQDDFEDAVRIYRANCI